MNMRRLPVAAVLLIGCTVPLLTAATAAGAATTAAASLCAPPEDTVGPVVTQVTFGKPSIDLDTGSRVQTVTATASDTSGHGDPSGVNRVVVYISGKGFGAAPKLQLTSGTPVSGTWTGQFSVSKYAHPGTYSIEILEALDAAGNEQSYFGFGTVPNGPNALSLHPADNPTFTVTGTPATRPHKRPGTLSSFAFSPAGVDTRGAAQQVRFVAKFDGPAPERVTASAITSKRSKDTRFVYLRATLHHRHGHWSGTLRVPRWLGRQVLQTELFAQWGPDYRPGGRSYNPEQLHRLGFPGKLAVVSRIDTSRPTLTSLSISPNPIDSTAGTEEVTVTAEAADTRSGVRSIDVYGGIRHGINGVPDGAYPLSAAGIGYLSSDNFHVRLKKTAGGDWVGTTKVKRCVPSGTYKLSATLRDVAGNYHGYGTKDLARAGITSTVEVTSEHGDIADPYVYSAATYGADSNLFLNFSEGVANLDTSTLTVFPLSPRSGRYTTTAPVTQTVCANGHSTVDCSGSGGLVTSAKLTIPSLDPGKKYEVYFNLNQVAQQLTDGNGNPLDWNRAATEVRDSRSPR